MDNSGTTGPTERELYLMRFDAGQYLKELRGERTLSAICKLLKVTPAHLSEIERGRLPTDHLISLLASIYEVDEDDLFRRFGKIPIMATTEVANNPALQNTLAEIARNKKLTAAQKSKLYEDIHSSYVRFIKGLK
jgi:transcriptional regulator with XRE-family HTH domain